MSIETSVTVTATGPDAFKLLVLINEAGRKDSVSVNQEEAPLEGGINLNELLELYQLKLRKKPLQLDKELFK